MLRRVPSPRQLNILTALVLLAITMIVSASPALADPADGSSDSESQSVSIVDSNGVAVDEYSLSLDTGSSWDPTDSKKIMAPLADTVWSFYVQNMKILIFIFHYILTAGWLDVLIAPIRGLASGAEAMVSTIGLYPLMCLLLAVSVAISLFKGHTARGFANLGVGVLIAALSIGLLAHPSDEILAEGGLITQAQSASTEVNNEFFPGATADSMTSQLVDTLVRAPHQIINYGEPVDGTDCEEVYNQTLGADDAWEKVGDCNADMKAAAQQASGRMIARMTVLLGPVTLGFLLYSYGIIAILMYVAISAAWSGLSMTWNMVLGIASGGARQALLRAGASLLVSLAALVALQVFVTGWMQLTNVALGSQLDVPAEVRFPLAGLLLLIGPLVLFIFYHRSKKRAKEAAKQLAAATGGTSGEPSDLGRQARHASTVARNALEIGSRVAGHTSSTPSVPRTATSTPAPTSVSSAAATPTPRSLPSGGSGAPALPAGSTGPRPGGGSSSAQASLVRTGASSTTSSSPHPEPITVESTVRRTTNTRSTKLSPQTRERLLRAAITVGQVGLAAATGGSSAAISAAGHTVASGVLSAGASRVIGGNSGPSRPPMIGSPSPTRTAPPRDAAAKRAQDKARADQLRQRLHQPSPVHMEPTGNGAIDRDTGQTYRTIRVGDQEFLEPRRQS